MKNLNVFAIVLVGGKRMELMPLVKERAKAALPMFGEYRIIDFALSNLINSDIRRINVMVQYKYHSLLRHIRDGWSILSPSLKEYINVYPPQQRDGERWYEGTADAIYQNLMYIEEGKYDLILIVHGDHICSFDYRNIIAHHVSKKADCTIAAITKPLEESSKFGNLKTNSNHQVTDFQEKPSQPLVQDELSNEVWINAGVYVFKPDVLMEEIMRDAEDPASEHNLSKNILPNLIHHKKVYAFEAKYADGSNYPWHYFHSLDEYYDVNFLLLNTNKTQSSDRMIDLYDPQWPYRTYFAQTKTSFINSETNLPVRRVVIGNGTQIRGHVENSIIGTNVTIEAGAVVKNSIVFSDVVIQKGAIVDHAIIDKFATVESGSVLDREHAQQMGTTTPNGLVILERGATYALK